MKHRTKFKCPRCLICDVTLPLTARQIGAALYAYTSYNGIIKKSYREIGRITGRDTKTVKAAVDQLAAAGYIQIKHTTRWDEEHQMAVNDSNRYTLSMDFSAGYALVPYSIFKYHELTPAAFVVALYIFLAAGAAHGKERRAYPSIQKIMDAIGIGRSTVCRTLKALKELPMFLVQLCRKINGALTCNSYHIVNMNAAISQEQHSHHDGNGSADTAAVQPVPAQRPILARICASVRTSIVNLAKNIGNALLCGGVVPNFLHKERNKITKAII